jgi:hypothetical protein
VGVRDRQGQGVEAGPPSAGRKSGSGERPRRVRRERPHRSGPAVVWAGAGSNRRPSTFQVYGRGHRSILSASTVGELGYFQPVTRLSGDPVSARHAGCWESRQLVLRLPEGRCGLALLRRRLYSSVARRSPLELRRCASGPDTGVIQRTCTACSGDVAKPGCTDGRADDRVTCSHAEPIHHETAVSGTHR